MKDDPLSKCCDILLRRELTAEEEATLAEWLERHPARAAEWRESVILARGVRALSPTEVPSNFTTRVLEEVRLETRRAPGSRLCAWRWPRRTIATLAVVLGLGTFGVWKTQRDAREAGLREVAALRALAAVPPDVLEDFEVIRRLADGSMPIDYDLLAALQ